MKSYWVLAVLLLAIVALVLVIYRPVERMESNSARTVRYIPETQSRSQAIVDVPRGPTDSKASSLLINGPITSLGAAAAALRRGSSLPDPNPKSPPATPGVYPITRQNTPGEVMFLSKLNLISSALKSPGVNDSYKQDLMSSLKNNYKFLVTTQPKGVAVSPSVIQDYLATFNQVVPGIQDKFNKAPGNFQSNLESLQSIVNRPGSNTAGPISSLKSVWSNLEQTYNTVGIPIPADLQATYQNTLKEWSSK